MSKKTIAILSSVEGHLSIAEAVMADLQKDYIIKLYVERDDLFDFYVTFYKYFPAAMRVPFYLTKRVRLLKVMHQYCKNKYFDKVEKYFKKTKPDLVISTYFMYNSSIEELCEKGNIPFINILADPYTVHPMLISKKANINALFDKTQWAICRKIIKVAKYQEMGWFVRPQFENTYDKVEVRKKLNLDPDTLTFLIASGSEGSSFVSTIFPSLLSSSKKLQIIIACGNNKNLFRTVQVLSELTEKVRDRIELIPLAFTDQIYLYMQASDLVIGKAGPNTLFESVATHTPFFAITHIPGQEDGNLTIIRNYKLGYVEENPFKAGRLLKKIMDHPQELEKFTESINTLATHNKNAKKILLQEVDKLLN
ncbi:hypothetical protein BH10PAT2_BH10PAT2_2350 [soil metagenome]